MENPDDPEAPKVPSVLASSVLCLDLTASVPYCSVPSKKTPMLNGATREHTVLDIAPAEAPKTRPQCRPYPLAAIAVPIRVVLIAAVLPPVPFGI